MLAHFFGLKQLKLEDYVIMNSPQTEQRHICDFPENFVVLPNFLPKETEQLDQRKSLRYKNVGWKISDKPSKGGRERGTKLLFNVKERVESSPGNQKNFRRKPNVTSGDFSLKNWTSRATEQSKRQKVDWKFFGKPTKSGR